MLWLIAILFAVIQNAHFGWNRKPKNDAEMICDGIVWVLVAIAASKHL